MPFVLIPISSASHPSLGIHADRSAIVSIHVLKKFLALLHACQEFIGSWTWQAQPQDVHDLHFGFHVYVSEDTPKDIILIHTSQILAIIRAPGMDTLKIPLAAKHSTINDVSVWEWSGSAFITRTSTVWFLDLLVFCSGNKSTTFASRKRRSHNTGHSFYLFHSLFPAAIGATYFTLTISSNQ